MNPRGALVLLALSALLAGGGSAGAAPVQPDRPAALPLMMPLVATAPATAFPPVTAPDPVVQGMVDRVLPEVVRQYTGDLSGAWPVVIGGTPYTISSRYTNSGTPIQRATQYVGDHLDANHLSVEYHRWGPESAPNVIGTLAGEGRPGDIFMITAHLDSASNGMTAPGADDNASGSAAVMVASDILTEHRWDCTFRFAFWTGEEQGLLGSDKYAQRARGKGDKILGVLNFDMIAWNSPGSTPDIDLHASTDIPATIDLAYQMVSVIDAYDLDLVPEVLPGGTGASDHASFWQADYTAILGIEDYYPSEHDFNPYYHTTHDTLDQLNLPYFVQFVKAAVAGAVHMAGCRVPGPVVTPVLSNGELQLQWSWDTDDSVYEVRRSADPYFDPLDGVLVQTVVPMLPNPVIYPDAQSGAGDPDVNHFYVIRGMKDGRGAVSNRVGEFDFALRAGE